ncbi:MAG: hypothetical protein KDK39_03950 [Leptospiraceae bacterium]|nr:hypothetical protein [Leptospiraceae bacterium]
MSYAGPAALLIVCLAVFYPTRVCAESRADPLRGPWQAGLGASHERFDYEWQHPDLRLSLDYRPDTTSAPENLRSLQLILEKRALPAGERGYGSGRLRRDHVSLDFGRRFLPGPPGSFLLDRAYFSRLPGVPHGRHTGSFWPGYWLEDHAFGLLGLENQGGAGLWWQYTEQFRLAIHPAANSATCTALSQSDSQWHYYLDLNQENQDRYGYGRLAWQRRFAAEGYFILEAGRSVEDDVLPATGDSVRDTEQVLRRGRNGQAALEACFAAWICVEGAGRDQADAMLRSGGLYGLYPLDSLLTGQLVFGWWGLARRDYLAGTATEPDSISPNQLDPGDNHDGADAQNTMAADATFFDQAALAGWRLVARRHFLLLSLVVPRMSARRLLLEYGVHWFDFELALALGLLDPGNQHPANFIWLRQNRMERSSWDFRTHSRSVLAFEVRHRTLFFSLTVQDTKGQTHSLARLQWLFRF